MIDWQAVVALTGILFFVCGLLFGAIKWLMDRNIAQLDERFESAHLNASRIEERQQAHEQEQALKAERLGERLENLRVDLKEFQIEVARDYVEHDDWVRVEGGQNIMLQRISGQISELAVSIGAQEATSSAQASGGRFSLPESAEPYPEP